MCLNIDKYKNLKKIFVNEIIILMMYKRLKLYNFYIVFKDFYNVDLNYFVSFIFLIF